jgi:hypothetical protein
MVSAEAKDTAVSHALRSIRKEKRFPHQVLAGHWEDYLFFEPHMMFDRPFIYAKNLLLADRQGSVIALINLGNCDPNAESSAMFLERETELEEYVSKLKGDGSPMNWLFLMDRYVCASDRGDWTIYCEKENDVAVFAHRVGFPQPICTALEALLGARSIRSASSYLEKGRGFDFDKLVPEWKYALIAEYV